MNYESIFKREACYSRFSERIYLDHGWYHDNGLFWSSRNGAKIFFDINGLPECRGVVLKIKALCATPENVQYINWKCDSKITSTTRLDTPGEVFVFLSTDCLRQESNGFSIGADLAWYTSPFLQEMSQDDRLLGIALCDAFPVFQPPTKSMSFTEESEYAICAISGWAQPESDGIWQLSQTAYILISDKQLARKKAIELYFSVLSSPSQTPEFDVGVSVPMFKPKSTKVSGPNLHKMTLKRSFWPSKVQDPDAPDLSSVGVDGINLITVSIAGRKTPLELGLNEDARQLGIKLARIKLVDWWR